MASDKRNTSAGLAQAETTVEQSDVHTLQGRLDQAQCDLQRARREREQTQTYLDLAPVFFVSIDPGLRVEYINHKGAHILGYRPEELRGAPWLDRFVAPGDRARAQGSFARLLRGEVNELEGCRVAVLKRTGEREPLSWNCAARRAPDGSVLSILSMGTDISTRDRATRALLESEHRFRRLIETAAEGVWTIDAEGRTTLVNGAMAAMLGYRNDEMIGRHLFEFLDQEAKVIALQKLDLRRSGVREVHEFPLRHRDGHEVWTIMAVSPIEDELGAYQGALAMVTDATPARRAEQERAALLARMLETQKLESLGALAAGIAHDFNNLLAAVMGHVEIATHEPDLSARAKNALDNALAATQRAAGLTRQLLDYAGESQLEMRPLRLSAQVEELVDLLRASVPKNIHIVFTTDTPSLAVLADPDRFQQAIMNLILNAAEAYEGRSGTVYVTVGEAQIGEDSRVTVWPPAVMPPGQYAYLEVRDEGIGMSEDTLARVFDPFFTTKTTGRGLGLAACLGIIRTHGGHLSVSSQLGKGTSFRAYLARSEPLEPPVPEAPPAGPELATIHPHGHVILVVDDEPMVREFAQRLLESQGYRVLEAESGSEALALLKEQHDIDVVLLDFSMPGMDGYNMLAKLREFAPDIPVVVHSGYPIENTSERLAPLRVNAVLQKPYRAAKLRDVINKALHDAKKT